MTYTKQNTSFEFRVVCKFFKKIGYFKKFIEYQENNQRKYYNKIPAKTKNPLGDFGRTSLTSFIDNDTYLRGTTLFELFRYWLTAYHPQLFISFCKPYGSEDNYEKFFKEFRKNKGTLKISMFGKTYVFVANWMIVEG